MVRLKKKTYFQEKLHKKKKKKQKKHKNEKTWHQHFFSFQKCNDFIVALVGRLVAQTPRVKNFNR